MNDKTTELYAAACLYAREQQLDLKDKNVPAFVECMSEKFAELIVRECAGLLEKEAESNYDEATEPYNLLLKESEWMKQHFGIKDCPHTGQTNCGCAEGFCKFEDENLTDKDML